MELHVYVDNSDLELSRLEEITQPICNAMSDWINTQKLPAQLLSEPSQLDAGEGQLGLSIHVKSKYKLKEPLNFLYTLAKKYKCEFVISQVCPDSGAVEDVCYFGFEEGRPDLFEVANYLSL